MYQDGGCLPRRVPRQRHRIILVRKEFTFTFCDTAVRYTTGNTSKGRMTAMVRARTSVSARVGYFRVDLLNLTRVSVSILIFDFRLSGGERIRDQANVGTRLRVVCGGNVDRIRQGLSEVMATFVREVLYPFRLQVEMREAALIRGHRFKARERTLVWVCVNGSNRTRARANAYVMYPFGFLRREEVDAAHARTRDGLASDQRGRRRYPGNSGCGFSRVTGL